MLWVLKRIVSMIVIFFLQFYAENPYDILVDKS